MSLLTIAVILLIVIGLALSVRAYIKNKDQKDILYMIALSIAMMTVALPFATPSHLAPASIVTLCTFVNSVKLDYKKISVVIKNVMLALVFMCVISVSAMDIIRHDYMGDTEFRNVPLEFSFQGHRDINSKNAYYRELGFSPVIISESKAVFSILDGTFDSPYDFSGMDSPLNYTKNLPKKTIVVISENYKEDNWQNPGEVFDYVAENYILVDAYKGFLYYLVPEL